MSRALRVGWLILLLLPAARAMAAAGSWVASAPAVRVAVPGRQYLSAPLGAAEPERLTGQRLVSLSWRYQVPAGRQVQAWLCQREHCLHLSDARGKRRLWPGFSPDSQVRFRFALPSGEQRPLTVQGLQLIVNYR